MQLFSLHSYSRTTTLQWTATKIQELGSRIVQSSHIFCWSIAWQCGPCCCITHTEDQRMQPKQSKTSPNWSRAFPHNVFTPCHSPHDNQFLTERSRTWQSAAWQIYPTFLFLDLIKIPNKNKSRRDTYWHYYALHSCWVLFILKVWLKF